jgi:histidyl-tRNA synthetase
VDNQLPFFQAVPKIKDSLSDSSLARFQQVLKGLDQLSLPYSYNPFLVRGLDYYNDTVFEFSAQVDEKTRLALGGGGRYDQLVKEMGGPDTAAIGFACGMERLLLVAETELPAKLDFYLISLTEQLIGLNIITNLRSKGYHCLLSYQTSSLKNQMTNAFKFTPHYILILGEDEIKNKQVTVKDCLLNTQVTISLSKFYEEFSGGK